MSTALRRPTVLDRPPEWPPIPTAPLKTAFLGSISLLATVGAWRSRSPLGPTRISTAAPTA